MTQTEIIALVVTVISLLCFSIVFTVLFSHYCKGASEEVLSGKKDIELLDNEFLQKKRKKKNRRVIGYIKKGVSYTVLIVLIAFLGISVYSKVANDPMPFGNTTVLTVASGSMSVKHESNTYLTAYNLENQFQTYDLIFITRTEEKDLKLYDVVAYRNDENTIIIHRIVKIEETGGKNRYYTRGDANNANDSFVSTYEDIIGVYSGTRIPLLGVFVLFLQSYSGMVTIIAIIYCLWMFDSYYSKLKKACYARVETLTSVIKDPLDLSQFKTSYVQYIYYQGNIYEFLNGEFRKKTAGSPTDDPKLYVLSQEEGVLSVDAQDPVAIRPMKLSPEEEKKTIEEIKNKLKE